MATVSMGTWTGDAFNPPALSGALHQPYTISRTINIADVVTKKGTALAAADVIEVLNIPTGTAVIAGWIRKVDAIQGTASVMTLSYGITGVAATAWASAYDYFAAAVGAYTGSVSGQIVGGAADTLDILIASLTGTWTGGSIVVEALCIDIYPIQRPGLAQPKS